MISLFRELVCEVYGITTDEFNSRTKRPHVVEARALFFKLCSEAKIVDKEIVMFMGRTIQSTRTYKDILTGDLSDTFYENYARCKPIACMIVGRCKNSSTLIHPITRYTKAEELMILRATLGAMRFMRRYCALSE